MPICVLTTSSIPVIEQVVGQTANATYDIDLTLIVAIAALVLSIVSPFVSSLISGHYRIKERELDAVDEHKRYHRQFYEAHRAEVIERYISAASNRIASDTMESEANYLSAMSEVYLYLDEPLWKFVYDVNSGIDTNDESLAISSLLSLCKNLAREGIRK